MGILSVLTFHFNKEMLQATFFMHLPGHMYWSSQYDEFRGEADELKEIGIITFVNYCQIVLQFLIPSQC